MTSALRSRLLAALLLCELAGCGGVPGPDAGSPDAGFTEIDAGLTDSGTADSGTADSGTADAGTVDSGVPACQPTSCGGGQLCQQGACTPCTDRLDDSSCSTVFGAGHLCIAGACVIAECHDSAGCDGRLCDPSRHTCNNCSTGAACSADPVYGPAALCNAGPGVCLRCEAVAAVDGLVLHVNPIDGSDSLGSGATSAVTPGCAFRTLTRAVQAAAAAGKKTMTIVVDVPSTLSAATGEVFPVSLPADTTVTASSGAVVLVQASSGDAFQLAAPRAGLRGLTLDGQGTALDGVVVSAASVVLSALEVKGFTGAGVRANDGAVLTLTGASALHDNGVPGAPSGQVGPAGLLAVGSAQVSVDDVGASELAPLRISSNLGRGIEVRGQAQVNVTGTRSAQTPVKGTIQISGNALDGIFVQQLLVASGAAGPTGMSFHGVVSTGNGSSGLHVFGGSGVTVRGSFLSGNLAHGVHVQTSPGSINGGSGANDGNDLTRIDLGSAGASGHTILQDATAPNGLKGACTELQTGAGTGGPLKLEGNLFASGGSNVDCSTIAASLPATGDCLSQGALGTVGRNPKNDLDVAPCTIP